MVSKVLVTHRVSVRAPALLLVDFVNGFCDPDCFGGGNILDAVNQTRVLLNQARKSDLPIVHTRIVYEEDGAENGVFCEKVPGLDRLTETASISQIVDPLKPEERRTRGKKNATVRFLWNRLGSVARRSKRFYRHCRGLHNIGLCKSIGCRLYELQFQNHRCQ